MFHILGGWSSLNQFDCNTAERRCEENMSLMSLIASGSYWKWWNDITTVFSWLCLVLLLTTPSCQLHHKAARPQCSPVELRSVWTTGALQLSPPPCWIMPAEKRRSSLCAALPHHLHFVHLYVFVSWSLPAARMPFPPLSLHQRISSPGRDLFGKKKSTGVPAHTELTSKSGGEKAGSDREKQSSPWTTANLRNLGRKAHREKSKSPTQKSSGGQETQGKSSWLSVPKPQDSEGVRRSSSMDSARHLHGKDEGKKEIQFTLSLTPEAILVIQKRNIEKQMMAKQQKCCASADFRHRRVFPSKKAHGSSNKGSAPVAKAESVEQDITAIVKISLLNDQYKYDDVEYEDEDGDVDETVVRKCKEWLKGVENAAALGEVDKRSALPHLKGCWHMTFELFILRKRWWTHDKCAPM